MPIPFAFSEIRLLDCGKVAPVLQGFVGNISDALQIALDQPDWGGSEIVFMGARKRYYSLQQLQEILETTLPNTWVRIQEASNYSVEECERLKKETEEYGGGPDDHTDAWRAEYGFWTGMVNYLVGEEYYRTLNAFSHHEGEGNPAEQNQVCRFVVNKMIEIGNR